MVFRPSRLQQLSVRQQTAALDCVALMPGPNLQYVTGLTLSTSERPIVAFFPREGTPAVLLPMFEQGRVEKGFGGQDIVFVTYTDEEGYQGAFARVVDLLKLDDKRVAVEYLYMRALELRQLEQAAPKGRFVSLDQVLPGLRAVKDEGELDAMRGAIAITEKALQTLIAEPLIGLTEHQIVTRLEQAMVDGGADSVAFIIAVAGPNGADPHAGPSDRPVQAGDLLTIDCGAVYRGYPADITRTFALGQVDAKLKQVYEVVQRANAAGKQAVKPGVAAQEVDRAARRVIDTAGYGPYFTHRTGHGLGIQVHEPPYIVEGNTQVLEPGMVFTVEPGIYIPGLGGVRIEDDVVVTADGGESLTTFPREWRVIQ